MAKKAAKKTVKIPPRLELLRTAVAEQYRHDSSMDIGRRRDLIIIENNMLEIEIEEVAARLAELKKTRATNEAVAASLTSVIAKR